MTPSPIRDVMALAEARDGLIRLEVGEPDLNTPAPIIRAAQEALDAGWTKYTSAAVLASRPATAAGGH
jgi:aspartate aminotransferase